MLALKPVVAFIFFWVFFVLLQPQYRYQQAVVVTVDTKKTNFAGSAQSYDVREALRDFTSKNESISPQFLPGTTILYVRSNDQKSLLEQVAKSEAFVNSEIQSECQEYIGAVKTVQDTMSKLSNEGQRSAVAAAMAMDLRNRYQNSLTEKDAQSCVNAHAVTREQHWHQYNPNLPIAAVVSALLSLFITLLLPLGKAGLRRSVAG